MGKLSAGQKRRQKDLKRKRKQAKANSTKAALPPKVSLPKLSETILEFAEPILEGADTAEDREKVLDLAISCWNIGCLKGEHAEKGRREVIDTMLLDAPEEVVIGFKTMIDSLIIAKRMAFNDDYRIVMDYEVLWRGKKPILRVYSTLPPEEKRNTLDDIDILAGLSEEGKEGFQSQLLDNEEHYAPLTDEQSKIIRQVNKGYGYIDSNHQYSKAADAWLEAWESVKSLYADEKSLTDIPHLGDLYLAEWADELEVSLHNAGLSDPAYFEKRLNYCRDYCSSFPDTNGDFIFTMRRAEAETYFFLGRSEDGESAFQTLTTDFPGYTWGYIGWGDMYNASIFKKFKTPIKTDYQKARELYQIPIDRGLVDADDAQERLDNLERKYKKDATVLEA